MFTAFHSFLIVLRPVRLFFSFYARVLNAFNLKSFLHFIEMPFSSYFSILSQDVKGEGQQVHVYSLSVYVFHGAECDHQSETLCLSQLISFVFSCISPINL